MYTQCNNCEAIFRVTMKELTSAQGLLRCGECGNTFDAMKSLSTTLPEDRKFIKKEVDKPKAQEKKAKKKKTPKKKKAYLSPLAKATEAAKKKAGYSSPTYSTTASKIRKHKTHSTKFLLIALISLSLLLVAQIIYKQKDWLAEQSLTAGVTRAFCQLVGCEIEKRRDISKIEMVNKNIYSHPNEPSSLVVSASLENKAEFDQPFPLIEISLLDSKSEIVALRRFTPKEYLKTKFEPGIVMLSNSQVDLKVHIADPGDDAIRFQFKFL